MPFVDFGYGWNPAEERGRDRDVTLTSVGLGARLRWHDALRAELFWALPLSDRPDTEDGSQNAGIHFSMTVGFF